MDAQRPDGEDREAGTSPTYPPPPPHGLSPCWSGTSRRCSFGVSGKRKRRPSRSGVAEAITRFTGSMRFVYLHLAVFGFWFVANLGCPRNLADDRAWALGRCASGFPPAIAR